MLIWIEMGKGFCEKLTVQLLYLDHTFLIDHMLNIHKHMLCLFLVILLSNYCTMVNFAQTPYDQCLKHCNSYSFFLKNECSLLQLQSWITLRTLHYKKQKTETKKNKGKVEHVKKCSYRPKQLNITKIKGFNDSLK